MTSEDSSDDENFDSELLIRNFEEEAKLLLNGLLPQKSKKLYLKAYEDFIEWKEINSGSFDENVFLVYFEELSKNVKPPTLWSIWSKLKATLRVKENFDLDKYKNLKTYLINKNKGYRPKKSKTLTLSEVIKFLELADDTIYLAMKVILIVGFFGCLRCQEILNLKNNDIVDYNDHFIINVNETKTDISRNFIISNEYYQIVKNYKLLRPDEMEDSARFFVNYQKGKCVRQFIGKNKISEIPSIIATYLQLPEPEKYTGHCYRRSSATALSNAGGNLVLVKNHGGWKSDTVAQGYIDFSTANRKQIFDMIANSSNRPRNHFLNHPPINNIISATNVPKDVRTTKANANLVSILSTDDKMDAPSDVPSTSNGQNDVYNFYVNDENANVSSEKMENRLGSDNTKDQVPRNKSSINIVHHHDTNLHEPSKKKIKSSLVKETGNEIYPKTLFQSCEIHTVNINNNYYCSCKDK